MERDGYPPELFKDSETLEERAARMGRWDILKEAGFFTNDETNLRLARKERTGSFIAQVRRQFSNNRGDTHGCSAADIENIALYLGNFDETFDVEATPRGAKYLKDK